MFCLCQCADHKLQSLHPHPLTDDVPDSYNIPPVGSGNGVTFQRMLPIAEDIFGTVVRSVCISIFPVVQTLTSCDI